MPRLALVLLAAALAGCLPGPPVEAEPPAPPLRPDAFFEGASRGFGTVTVRGGRPQILRVASAGRRLPDGSFRLDQTLRIGDGDPTERTWTLRETAPGVWTGALTDARGATTATIDGGALRIRYRISRWATMDQRLTLEPDGGAALNVATVRVLGVPVARVVERIRRVSGGA